jgi:hypothetical protein
MSQLSVARSTFASSDRDRTSATATRQGVQEASIWRPLLDHFVSEHEQSRRDAQPERLGRLHVDDQLDSCELLDR